MLKNKNKLLLILIVLLGVFLRFWRLDKIPVSPNWDEVSQGYNALSILKTAKDEWGKFLPLANFRAYGDYPTPFYMYATIPFIYFFGLSEITVRLPSAIFGSLLVLVTYYFCELIFKKKSVSLVTAFFVALSPWSLFLSRQAIQATPATLLLSLGIFLFIKGTRQNNHLNVLGTIVLGLSAYAYHNTRIFSPLIFLVLLFHYRKQILPSLRKTLLLLFISGIFFIPLFFVVLSPEGRARSAWVGIFDQGAINDINSARGASALSPFLAKLAHNKLTYFVPKVLSNYTGYFSPKFLGLQGGTQYQFNVQGFGIINPLDLLLLYLGLVLLIVRYQRLDQDHQFLLYWLLLAPLPAAVTRDPYQVVRATTMLPVVYLVVAYGLSQIVGSLKNWPKNAKLVLGAIFSITYLIWFGLYVRNWLSVYNDKYSQAWQYGYKQAITYVKENYTNYEHIVFTKKYGEPHEFVLFFNAYDPTNYRKDAKLVRYGKSNWFWVDSFDKYLFINDWEIKAKSTDFKNTLLITSPGNYNSRGKLLKIINFLDGTPAFAIVAY